MKSILQGLIICFLAHGSFNAVASDGIIEINQACAQTGCYPGDAPGFPVFIQQPGSYQLTGNLDLSGTPDTTGIQISSAFVTLDLNGFEIAGPKVCTGTGPTLDCGGVEDGAGVLIEADARAVVVRNGTVRNMGTEGIWSFADGATIENIRAMHNARNGLRGQSNTLVIDCVAIENIDDGFDFGSGSVIRGATALGNGDDGIEIDGPYAVVDGASSRGNGNRGYNLSHSSKFKSSVSLNNVGTDSCGGGLCTERVRYYLSTGARRGDTAMQGCVAGFHMASMFEILDMSHLQYDRLLGPYIQDIGSGPTAAYVGWIRTGLPHGSPNCNGWTTQEETGWVVRLKDAWNDSSVDISPWEFFQLPCVGPNRVWCVEDP